MPVGRPPKPTAIRKAEGNLGHRPLNENEPEPTPGFGRRPLGLSPFGRRIWRVTTAELDRMNLITVVDHGALVAAVSGADNAYLADKAIRLIMAKIAEQKAGHDDFSQLSILNSVSRKGWQQWKAFGTEFGFTPASRTRLTVEATPARGVGRPKRDDFEEAYLSAPIQPVQ